MKKETLVLVALGVGAVLLLSAKKKAPKKRGYKIIVPPPEKITAEQFKQPTIFQKAAPVVKKLSELLRRRKRLSTQQTQAVNYLSSGARLFGGVGQFPDTY